MKFICELNEFNVVHQPHLRIFHSEFHPKLLHHPCSSQRVGV